MPENNHTIYDKDNDQYFVQVISGVAGSDTIIYQEYTSRGDHYPVQPFVASYNLKTVGFGLMTVHRSNIDYKHYGVSLQNRMYLLDNFSIEIRGDPDATENEL